MAEVVIRWVRPNVAECTVDGVISEGHNAYSYHADRYLVLKNRAHISVTKVISSPWAKIIEDLFSISAVRRIGGVETTGNILTVHFLRSKVSEANQAQFENLLLQKLGADSAMVPGPPSGPVSRIGKKLASAIPKPPATQPTLSSSHLHFKNRIDALQERAKNPRVDATGRKQSLLR